MISEAGKASANETGTPINSLASVEVLFIASLLYYLAETSDLKTLDAGKTVGHCSDSYRSGDAR
jgi:hypothetical protein